MNSLDANFGFGALQQKVRSENNWLDNLTITLDEVDARFLRTQIKRAQAKSLLAALLGLLESGKSEVLTVAEAHQLKNYSSLSPAQNSLLRHCRTYELICRSCLLTYNEALGQVNKRLIGVPGTAREALYTEVEASLRPHHLTELFAAFPRDAETNRFLLDWSTRVFNHTDHGPEAIQLITRREIRMKGDRARLKNHSRAEELEDDATPGLSLTDEGTKVAPVFSYRWPTVRNHLLDLFASILPANA
jgi:hypothetical protein